MPDSAEYRVYGKSSLYTVWGDGMVYRNLAPPDGRLPSFEQLRQPLGLEGSALPRKVEVEYGRVVAEILRQARHLDLPGVTLKQLVYLGDTHLLDGSAFQNLCAAGGWPGWAFIGQDRLAEPSSARLEAGQGQPGSLYVANRWSALEDFRQLLEGGGFGLDESTALVIDMDKTAVGGRGRNDKPIDEARLEGVRRTVASLLGADFDEAAFRSVYAHLNQPAYHPFTADNQDYLAYICLMLGTPLFDFETLLEDIRCGTQASFFDFINQVQDRRADLPGNLSAIHADVWGCVQAGDPTPFKAFRYNEYLTTVARFGGDPAEPVEQLLTQRILITHEVCQFAARLKQQGVLVFGLSDKPDEASLPSEEQALQGMQPLHRMETLTVHYTGR